MQDMYHPDFRWLFISEAKGIQQYLFATDKLRHMTGASQIIEEIPKAFLDRCLEAFQLTNDCIPIVRAAGRAVLLFRNENAAREFAAAWPVMVREFAPGVEIVQAFVEVTSGNINAAMESARKILLAKRQKPGISLPAPGPLAARSRRDGQASIGRAGDDDHASREIIQKLMVADDLKRKNLLHKIFTDSEVTWPHDFSQIAGGEKDYIAVIHADANGMGKLLQEINKALPVDNAEKYIAAQRKVSDSIQKAANDAARAATIELLHNNKSQIMPLQPLVLAGDDLTMVIKAPLAINFIKTYITIFQKNSFDQLQSICKEYNVKDFKGFSVSAGVAFVKCSYPFKSAYQLCEELCKTGKNLSRREYSTISFWRQSTATADSYEEICRRELTVPDGDASLVLTEGAYALESGKELPWIEDLLKAVTSMGKLPRGSLRQLANEMYSGRSAANRAWERIADIANERLEGKAQHTNPFNDFVTAMTRISGNQHEPLWRKSAGKNVSTALLDAVELHSIKKEVKEK